jgi:hypothetical protein
VGVVWVAWAVLLFAPTLVLGVLLAAKSGARCRLARATRWLLGAQIALGAVLGLFWLVSRLR